MVKKIIKRYLFFIFSIIVLSLLSVYSPALGKESISVTLFSFREMLFFIPPIFVLLGLLDVWVPREAMIRFMGEGSGVKGILIAFFIGSAAAGPLYAAFPLAAVLLKKGAKLENVFIFLGAWSTTKVPMFLFEYSSLGAKFAITRLLLDIPGIIIIGFLLKTLISQRDREKIYEGVDFLL